MGLLYLWTDNSKKSGWTMRKSIFSTDKSFEKLLTILAILCALVCFFALVTQTMTYHLIGEEPWVKKPWEFSLFLFIAMCIAYSIITYLVTRYGYLSRLPGNDEVKLDDFSSISEISPRLTVLVPSYKEEIKTIEQTLFSAALQEHPNMKLVLLLDDPPAATALKDQRHFNSTVQRVEYINQMLLEQRNWLEHFYSEFSRRRHSEPDWYKECLALHDAHMHVASWLRDLASGYGEKTHVDNFFVNNVFRSRAGRHFEWASNWKMKAIESGTEQEWSILEAAYQSLIAYFSVDISLFQRKRYENLSHAANKAMNLNAYIGLMGGRYREVEQHGKLLLERAVGDEPYHLVVEDSDYVLTLDADSILLPEYTYKLINKMQSQKFSRVAVMQTPYSGIPNPERLIERIASATTDIQYITHQGFTFFRSTFWVGANAVIRKEALDAIRSTTIERGYCLPVFIQDRTVIEDTESSIDLIRKGWSLHNHPERLSYSATPDDFGSLIIQRGRWANGGLIIMGKLLAYLLTNRPSVSLFKEGLIRSHYLTSIALNSVASIIIFFLLVPVSTYPLWLLGMSIPYFYIYARDLKSIGYKMTDLFRVYALNLMLIPVNIAGVVKSIEQLLTGKKISFKRTPKIDNRTPTPWVYLLAQYVMLLAFLERGVAAVVNENWLAAAFMAFHFLCLSYALLVYVGLKDAFLDLKSAIPVLKFETHRN